MVTGCGECFLSLVLIFYAIVVGVVALILDTYYG